MNIYPAILTDSLDEFSSQLELVLEQKKCQVLHVDVIDGFFVDNLTLTPADLIEFDLGRLEIDFHLMTEEPLSFLEEIINYQEYFRVRLVIGQIEKMTSQSDFVELLKERQIMAGLSLDLFTPLEEIDDRVFSKLDYLQLMAIEAGEQGKIFDDRVFGKIEEAINRARTQNPNLKIILDGGIKPDKLSDLEQFGLDGVVIGSGIWQDKDPVKVLENLYHD